MHPKQSYRLTHESTKKHDLLQAGQHIPPKKVETKYLLDLEWDLEQGSWVTCQQNDSNTVIFYIALKANKRPKK